MRCSSLSLPLTRFGTFVVAFAIAGHTAIAADQPAQEAGTTTGTLTVDGSRLPLVHAYALPLSSVYAFVPVPGENAKGETGYLVLITNQPVPLSTLRNGDERSKLLSKRSSQIVEIVVRADKHLDSARLYLPETPALELSTTAWQFHVSRLDAHGVAGKITMERPFEFSGKRVQIEATFSAPNLAAPSEIQRAIQLEPTEVSHYFALAEDHEKAGRYKEAEASLLKAKDVRSKDPEVYMQLASFYQRRGEFPKSMDSLITRSQIDPNNPEPFYTIGTFYWDKAFRDNKLAEAEKKDYASKGLDALNKALSIKPDYMEAIVYKNILLRMRAGLETDPKLRAAMIAEADRLRSQAEELRKKRDD